MRKGVPFRETHHVAGAAVRLAETRGVPLSSLTPADLRTLHPKFDDDVAAVWSFEHRCAGGGGRMKGAAACGDGRGTFCTLPAFLPLQCGEP